MSKNRDRLLIFSILLAIFVVFPHASRLTPHAFHVRRSHHLQVIQARLAGIVQEMQNSLFRTGYSTIIRESQDASCAISEYRRRSRRAARRAAAPHGRLSRLRRGDTQELSAE